jgi:hypothetical protein
MVRVASRAWRRATAAPIQPSRISSKYCYFTAAGALLRAQRGMRTSLPGNVRNHRQNSSGVCGAVRVLGRDHELGGLTLGVEGIDGDDAPDKVQVFQQRLELGDLGGLAVHIRSGHAPEALATTS